MDQTPAAQISPSLIKVRGGSRGCYRTGLVSRTLEGSTVSVQHMNWAWGWDTQGISTTQKASSHRLGGPFFWCSEFRMAFRGSASLRQLLGEGHVVKTCA